MTPPTALVLRALGLGDFFAGLPALLMLRRALPEHRIVLALPKWLWPLTELSTSVDGVCVGAELAPLVGAPHRPDVAVDLHGNGPGSVAVLRATDPAQVVAFATGQAVWREGEYEPHRWCRLVREAFGAAGPDPSVVGALPQLPEDRVPAGLTIVHCGAKAVARRWPPARFAAVAGQLRRDGHDVLVVAGPDQADDAARIAAEAGVRSTTSLALTELVALVGRARLLVCGDTGVAHVASNYATPSVVLFGPVPPAEWGPPPTARHQPIWRGTRRGDPHGSAPDPALLQITVEDVLAAAARATEGERCLV